MANEPKIEDSPFYVKYNRKMEDKSFKMEKDMLNALKKHFKAKYHDDIENVEHGKFRFGKYIRKTLGEYLQRQCSERKMFKKSLFALISMDSLQNTDNPIISPLFITNPSGTYDTGSIDDGDSRSYKSILFHQIHKVQLDKFDLELMHWSDPLQQVFKNRLEEFNTSTDDVYVLEMTLNNLMDTYHDGVYSNGSDAYTHTGANYIGASFGVYGVVYDWRLNYDFSIEIAAIKVYDKETMLDKLYYCDNDELYRHYTIIFKAHSKHFFELETLQKECNSINDEILALQDKLKDCHNRIKQIQNKSDD